MKKERAEKCVVLGEPGEKADTKHKSTPVVGFETDYDISFFMGF